MSFIVQKAGNQAVNVNPADNVDFHLTSSGSDWLWAVTSVFGLLALTYAVLFFVAEQKGSPLTRYALAAPFLISFIEFFFYFTYASNLGWTYIQAEFNHVTVSDSVTGLSPGIRQIFYSKFVAWFLSWPLLLFLLDLAGTSTAVAATQLETLSVFDMLHSLLVQIISTDFWVISLLVGALIRSSYKWGYWTFGAVAMFVSQGVIFSRQLVSLKVRGFSMAMLCIIELIVWLYFICWALSEGGNVIQPDSEAVFYGILDLCVFAIYPAFLLFIVAKFGKWPSFSLRGGWKKNQEGEIPYEKASGPSSVRESGETHVPGSGVGRTGAAHAGPGTLHTNVPGTVSGTAPVVGAVGEVPVSTNMNATVVREPADETI